MTPHHDDPRQPRTGYDDERRLYARMLRRARARDRRRWLARVARWNALT